MKKLWYSYIKELKLSSKSFYFYIEFVMAFLIIFILLFMIPEEMNQYEDEYLYFDAPEVVYDYWINNMLEDDVDGVIETREMKHGKKLVEVQFLEYEDTRIYLFDNKEDMIEYTMADRPKVGAVVRWDEDLQKDVYEYYLQGYENQRLRNLFLIFHNDDLEPVKDRMDNYEVKALGDDYVLLNAREMAVPSLMTFNGALMGMFVMAAYIFLDKGEGVIKAYAVTASKVWQYLMSKVMVMTTVTIITTTAIALAVMGTRPNYPMLWVLLITSSFAASAFGMIIASYYDNMTKAFAAIYTGMMVLMLPAIAYFIPSWQPLWITLIPTHFLIQGFKEIIVGNGDMAYVARASVGFLLAGVLLFLWSNRRFKKTLA